MKKLFALLCALMLPMAALADPLPLGENLSGVACFPQGTDETTAAYVYRYDYPLLAGADQVSSMINAFYAYAVDDALGFSAPMTAEEAAGIGIQAATAISSEVTCNTDAYFSVKITTESLMGAGASHNVQGHVFARTGDKAGQVVSLPYLLGILDADETDTWMQERQTAKADELVRTLVWDIIQEQLADGVIAYYDDLTQETFQWNFYPEEDFYLDADGNPVFFLQEGVVAPVTEGVLYFPFTLEELLDEI